MGLPGDNKEYWINRALALDAKLRELVEAAEWLDSFDMADPWWEEYAYDSIQMGEIRRSLGSAENAYYAALKAAKGE
jgi:hypothetical protein